MICQKCKEKNAFLKVAYTEVRRGHNVKRNTDNHRGPGGFYFKYPRYVLSTVTVLLLFSSACFYLNSCVRKLYFNIDSLRYRLFPIST